MYSNRFSVVTEFLNKIWLHYPFYQIIVTEHASCNWSTIDLAKGGAGIGCPGRYEFFCIERVSFVVPVSAEICFWHSIQEQRLDVGLEMCGRSDCKVLTQNEPYVIGLTAEMRLDCLAPFTNSLEEFHEFRATIQNSNNNSDTYSNKDSAMFWNATNSVMLARYLYENKGKFKIT